MYIQFTSCVYWGDSSQRKYVHSKQKVGNEAFFFLIDKNRQNYLKERQKSYSYRIHRNFSPSILQSRDLEVQDGQKDISSPFHKYNLQAVSKVHKLFSTQLVTTFWFCSTVKLLIYVPLKVIIMLTSLKN